MYNGIISDTLSSCTVTGCRTIGGSTSGTASGGFAGTITGGSVTDSSVMDKTVSGTSVAGGFAATVSGARIDNCFTYNVSVTGATAGGFVGRNDGSSSINGSSSYGTVALSDYSGAFAGMNYASISSCAGYDTTEGSQLSFAGHDEGTLDSCTVDTSASRGKISNTGGIGTAAAVPDIGEDAAAETPAVTLSDISGHWAESTIRSLVAAGVVSGYDDGTYKPQNPVTKGEFIKLLLAANGTAIQSGFTNYEDVNKSWAKDNVYTALSLGICDNIAGSSSVFGVDDPITRVQAAALMGRLVGDGSGGTLSFTDAAAVPEWAAVPLADCAEMGWQYMLLDEGWQPGTIDELGRKTYSGMNSWVSDVINYADSKGIGIIVWAASWDLDTPEERERLAEWADMGIKGVKVNFFDSETQTTLRLCDEITEETAALRLLVNYHGCSKPTGERRAWPHLITREAVYGTEHFLSGEGWGPTAQHNCTLPFTRGAVGPMDYTPAITNYYDKNYFSAGQKAALPIIFESGIQCFSDKPENYRNSVLAGLLKDFPAAWDETQLLSGEIGSSAVMMRRSGETYYIGMICNEQRTEDVRLDFLDEGAVYEAELYRDGASDTEITLERLLVKKGDIITVPETVHGGAAIKLTKTDIIVPYDAAGHWCETAVRQLVSEDRLNGYFGVELDPDAYITRAEFVTMLVTAAGIDAPAADAPFPDCTGSRAKNYIAAAVAEGIINGVSADEFAPDALITREQAVTIIGRYMKLSGGISLDFTDSSEISDYAKMYVSVCAKNGIINGYEDGSFRPKNMMTRGECAAIMALI